MQKLQKTGEKCLIVVDKNKRLLGTITDGDIRRAILDQMPTSTNIKKIYEKKCTYVEDKNYKIDEILKVIKTRRIDIIPVVNNKKIVAKNNKNLPVNLIIF